MKLSRTRVSRRALQTSTTTRRTSQLNGRFKNALRDQRSSVMEKMDASVQFLAKLFDAGVIADHQYHEVKQTPVTERPDKLLDILEKKPDRSFPTFLGVLAETDQQHIVDMLLPRKRREVRTENDYVRIPQFGDTFRCSREIPCSQPIRSSSNSSSSSSISSQVSESPSPMINSSKRSASAREDTGSRAARQSSNKRKEVKSFRDTILRRHGKRRSSVGSSDVGTSSNLEGKSVHDNKQSVGHKRSAHYPLTVFGQRRRSSSQFNDGQRQSRNLSKQQITAKISQHIYEALQGMKEEDWSEVSEDEPDNDALALGLVVHVIEEHFANLQNKLEGKIDGCETKIDELRQLFLKFMQTNTPNDVSSVDRTNNCPVQPQGDVTQSSSAKSDGYTKHTGSLPSADMTYPDRNITAATDDFQNAPGRAATNNNKATLSQMNTELGPGKSAVRIFTVGKPDDHCKPQTSSKIYAENSEEATPIQQRILALNTPVKDAQPVQFPPPVKPKFILQKQVPVSVHDSELEQERYDQNVDVRKQANGPQHELNTIKLTNGRQQQTNPGPDLRAEPCHNASSTPEKPSQTPTRDKPNTPLKPTDLIHHSSAHSDGSRCDTSPRADTAAAAALCKELNEALGTRTLLRNVTSSASTPIPVRGHTLPKPPPRPHRPKSGVSEEPN